MIYRSCFALRALLFVFFLLSLVPIVSAQDSSFAIVGDTRVGRSASLPVYRDIINRIDELGIKTIFIPGDAIDSPGKQTQWEQLLNLTGRDKTIHVAVGNHDANSEKSLRMYEQMLGRQAYYSVEKDNALFVILNTELKGQTSRITGEQLSWLANELKKDFKYKFVFLHQPVFPAFAHKYGLDRYPDDRDRLHQLFVSNHVSLVVAGHEHLYHRDRKDGVAYVISGGGGAKLLVLWPEQGGFHHYIIAKKSNEGYLFTVHASDGTVKDQFSIK